jgi:hypothetical protein
MISLTSWRRICVWGLTTLLLPVAALAQFTEVEPNQPCSAAQVIGSPGPLPATVAGSVGPVQPDVDFFRFTGGPGTRLRADLQGSSSGMGTLSDPYLGLFDSACNLLAISDDFLGLDSRLDFVVPADGVYILAASSCCDPEFTGGGGSTGSYTLRISAPPLPIGGIRGSIVDAVTGAPLVGDSPPFARANLFRCSGGFCDQIVASTSTGGDGGFLFETDFGGTPLEPGSFRVDAAAERYTGTSTAEFEVAAGEIADLGALPLQPPPVTIGNVQPCDSLPSEGGRCRYGFTVTNNTAAPLSIRAWSIVNASGVGSPLGGSVFPANLPRRVDAIEPQASVPVAFVFPVPADVTDGAFFCADAWISTDARSYLDTAEYAFLFCVSKVGGEFRIDSAKAARARGIGRFGMPGR